MLLPLLLCAISIYFFYLHDVKQVMADPGMKDFWGFAYMHGFEPGKFAINVYQIFSEVGSGDLFAIIFGIVGLSAFFFTIWRTVTSVTKGFPNENEYIRCYAILMIIVVLSLFSAGVLPIESRLIAFTIPSILVMIIYLLHHMHQTVKLRLASIIIATILYLGVTGNVFTTYITEMYGSEHYKKLTIYRNTEKAIIYAQAHNMPILITPYISYPYENSWDYPSHDMLPGNWILKAYPAYNARQALPVYPIPTLANAGKCFITLPPQIQQVMAGDGNTYHILVRQ